MNFRKPSNDHFQTLLQARLSRRDALRIGGSLGAVSFLGAATPAASTSSPLMGFANVAASSADEVVLPPGYSYRVLMSWGDPIHAGAPAFARDTDADAQAKQFGDNTDGMELFSRKDKSGEIHVLAVNNEYYNPAFFYPHGGLAQNLAEVRKAQHAHGVTLVELVNGKQGWQVKQDSPLNRRIHGNSECVITGAAAGADALKTSLDPSGRKAWGTLNNCGAGRTPWNTYLTCEENFNVYFGSQTKIATSATQQRYDLTSLGGYQWWRYDSRFDLHSDPNEANRFGWVVEIDPFDPTSLPKKRTALGRFKHENAETALAADGRVVVYMGDDAADEFLYKFVSHNVYRAGERGNAGLLDDGILYTARFHDDGSGQWVPLVFNSPGLTPKDGFKDQADILIRTREAASAVGATPMDRPEWVACHPSAPLVFCTLSNNAGRTEPNKPNRGKTIFTGRSFAGGRTIWTTPRRDFNGIFTPSLAIRRCIRKMRYPGLPISMRKTCSTVPMVLPSMASDACGFKPTAIPPMLETSPDMEIIKCSAAIPSPEKSAASSSAPLDVKSPVKYSAPTTAP